ncbi:unnamed protein product [Pleuronectes platessa]|uniref:Uncharacterized protein n=1 Tax=Pleuronectes platessa TaxID=8262 RepID=A0A9N7U057_PLEPL|nr:unnamed protein product [Pleuronectes platessa]
MRFNGQYQGARKVVRRKRRRVHQDQLGLDSKHRQCIVFTFGCATGRRACPCAVRPTCLPARQMNRGDSYPKCTRFKCLSSLFPSLPVYLSHSLYTSEGSIKDDD